MSDSLLKKEFRESDLQRIRNLISGQYGKSTQNIVGFEAKEERHVEGDIWTDMSGKTWTIQNGLRRSISKLQKARELVRLPLVCPKCGKALNTALDKKMYPLHGMCFDCVLKMEEDLRKAGLYDAYEKQLMSGNIENFVQELKDRIQHISDMKIEYSSDQGELEDWGGMSREIIESLEQWANLLTEKLGNA